MYKKISLSSEVQSVSIDRYNYIYFSDANDNLYKYDSTGTMVQIFSPLKKGNITLVEAWRNMNIFLFYRNFQEFVLLDRFLNPAPNKAFNRDLIRFARIATNSFDNNLWVVDEVDFSLKKYNISMNKVELTTPLDLLLNPAQYELTHIREYQNQLFINDKNSGVLVFDIFGNYKYKLPISGATYFNFFKDELYYCRGNEVRFYNIYTGAERTMHVPLSGESMLALVMQGRIAVFSKKTLYIYSY
ncbi:MAG: hypothetical protein NZ529_04845 [Cytophagaceae bacterium]|nr:hypothetical protein [Cytophagaceae bacterium]MDW8456103.1 hypothetical protein [Cytophagaceae bacterium]